MKNHDFSDLIQMVKNSPKLFIKIGSLVFFIALSLISTYQVDYDEEAVVRRFGKYYSTVGSGLHIRIPFVEDVNILKTKQILQLEFGFKARQENSSQYDTNLTEASMVSGDLNVANVEWVVQYQITNPANFLFKTKYPENNIRDVSESVMRRLVGDRLVSEVLTTGRAELESESKKLIQEVLDRYEQGVTIVSVQLQDINPPAEVKNAFNEVNKAKQDQEKMINEAEQQYNSIIPKAEGEAQEKISKAEGYATKVKNQAEGDVAKFEKIQSEYRLSPEITKKRIYLETMEEVFKNVKMTIIDSKLKGSVLPLMNINNESKK